MARGFVSGTRRGLALTAYSEVLLAIGLVVFLLFPERPTFLVVGIIGSVILGIPGGFSLYFSRHEFGPAHAKAIRRGAFVFALLGLSLVLALFQLTSIFPESGRIQDLRAPWFFLGLALVADMAAVGLLLWNLGGDEGRKWIYLAWILGGVTTILYLWRGWVSIEDYMARSGGVTIVPAESDSYLRDFVLDVVRPWAAALASIRIGFWPGLWVALSRVMEAEQEARQSTETPWIPPENEGRQES